MAEPAQRLLRDAGIRVRARRPPAARARCPTRTHDPVARADDIPVWVERPARSLTASPVPNQVAESGVVLDERAAGSASGAAGSPSPRRPGSQITAPGRPRRRTASPRRTRATVNRLPDPRPRHRREPASRSPGSVELAPSLDASEAIADLVSSGETLRQNGLVELDTILESEAVLIARRELAPARARADRAVRLLIDSVLAARPKRYVMLNARDDQPRRGARLLPGLDAPDGAAARARRHARRARCRRCRRGRPPARAAQAAGATGILVLPIEHLIP